MRRLLQGWRRQGRALEWRQDGNGAGVAYSLSTTSGGVVARLEKVPSIWHRWPLPLGAKGAAHADVACSRREARGQPQPA
jgi:hypothetical protein